MTDKNFNPYEILGISSDASDLEIKKAYKDCSKKLHPDAGGSAEEFANLKKAFDILTDPAKRNLYDEFGVDAPLDIENEARLVAISIICSVLDVVPNGTDIDEEIKEVFEKCLMQIKEQENTAKKARDRLQQRLDGIQKKPPNDFLTKEILRIIQNHNKTVKQAQLNYKIHDLAYLLSQDYQFEIVKITDNTNYIKIHNKSFPGGQNYNLTLDFTKETWRTIGS